MLQHLPNGIGTLGAVFLFGFAVFVHELGHFLVAKWAGVGVKKFAIGFGPVIVAVTRGGTEYSIRWIPFGGFVQLKGMIAEDEETESPAGEANKPGAEGAPPPEAAPGAAQAEPAPEPPSPAPRAEEAVASSEPKKRGSITEDHDALSNQHPLVRIAVFVAGVACNYLTAIVFMAILLAYGMPRPAERPNVIENVPETSKWYALGWRSGDHIVGIGRAPVTVLAPVLNNPAAGVMAPLADSGPLATWDAVAKALDAQLPHESRFETWTWLKRVLGFAPRESVGASVTLYATVERNGGRADLPLPAALLEDPQEAIFFSAPQPAYIQEIYPASPADRARLVKMDYAPGEKILPSPSDEMQPMPLKHGDMVLAVNFESVSTWSEMAQRLRSQPGKSVYLTVRRTIDKQAHTLLLMANLETDPEHPQQGQLGVMITGMPPSDGPREGMPILQAIATAPMKTLLLTDRMVAETTKFFATHSGRDIRRNLGGSAAIVKMAYESAQRGLGDYLWLFIVISVTLSVMNLLPVPVLDGGYVWITVIEMIIGRPIPTRVLAPILTAFTVLLILAFCLLFYNDFMNLVWKF
jgi:regulator of sigma E protease